MYLHKQIVICLVYCCIMMVNPVPAAKDIPDGFAPSEIFTRWSINLENLKEIFRENTEASVNADVTNNMNSRTHPYISLGPNGNWQGLQMRLILKQGVSY